jgi:hypothetical protein
MPKYFIIISITCYLVLGTSNCFASREVVNDAASESRDAGTFVRSRVIAFEDTNSERLIKGGTMIAGGILGTMGGDYIGKSIMSLGTLLEDKPDTYSLHLPAIKDMYDEGANSRFTYFAFGAIAAGFYSPTLALSLITLGVGDYLLNTNFLKSMTKWVLDPSISGPRYVSATVGGTVGIYAGLKIGKKIVDIKRSLLQETPAERIIKSQGIDAEVLILEAGEHIKELNRRSTSSVNRNDMENCLKQEMRISLEHAQQILAKIYHE